MSSASRNERLEALLAAKFELECCDDEEKAECLHQFEKLVADTLNAHPAVSKGDLIEAIAFKYHEYKAARAKAQRKKETL